MESAFQGDDPGDGPVAKGSANRRRDRLEFLGDLSLTVGARNEPGPDVTNGNGLAKRSTMLIPPGAEIAERDGHPADSVALGDVSSAAVGTGGDARAVQSSLTLVPRDALVPGARTRLPARPVGFPAPSRCLPGWSGGVPGQSGDVPERCIKGAT